MTPPNYSGRNPNFEATFAVNVGLTADQRVFPIRPGTAVKRGYTPGVLDGRGYLTAFASACGPLYYRAVAGFKGPTFAGADRRDAGLGGGIDRRPSHGEESAAGETADVELQAVLTLGELEPAAALDIFVDVIRDNVESPVMREALLSGITGLESALLERLFAEPDWTERSIGRELMLEGLAGVIAAEGRPIGMGKLLDQVAAEDVGSDWKRRSLLAGLLVKARGRRGAPLRLDSEPDFFRRLEEFEDVAFRRDLRDLASAIEWPGHPVAKRQGRVRQLTCDEGEDFAKGRQLFANYCAACHGTDGRGVKPLAPPLVDSQWVNGAAGRLIRIVLHGLEGPVTVAGKRWSTPEILPSMPSMAILRSDDLGAILTYIRRAWGHTADPVSAKTVHKLRQLNFGRLTPWAEAELLEIPADERLDQGDRPYDRGK